MLKSQIGETHYLYHGSDDGTFYTKRNWLSLSTTFPRKREGTKKP